MSNGRKLRNVLVMMMFAAISQTTKAQFFKHLTTADGLSNRRVYAIERDSVGYMWFLTNTGIDRYNGSNFTHFSLPTDGQPFRVRRWANMMQADSQGRIWEFGHDGNVFCFNSEEGRFDRVHIPSEAGQFTLSTLDAYDRLWFGRAHELLMYDTRTGKTLQLKCSLTSNPTCLLAMDRNTVVVAGESGLFWLQRNSGNPHYTLRKFLNEPLFVNHLFYNKPTCQLIIATQKNGVFAYQTNTRQLTKIGQENYDNVSVEALISCPVHTNELMVATTDAGVLKLQLPACELTPFLQADPDDEMRLPSNSISSLYMDEAKRLWMGTYPMGVTMYTCNYPTFRWYRHSKGNAQTIENEHVNGIMEDDDGDLWFATSGGISVLDSRKGTWRHLLQNQKNGRSNVFITLCEVEKGIVVAAGYGSGAYWVRKADWSCHYMTPHLFARAKDEPNRYVRSIYKDEQGIIWTGGYFNLGRIDWPKKAFRCYPSDKRICCIAPRNARTLWVGTVEGLFIFDKPTGRFTPFHLPCPVQYVSALHKETDGTLYIGTNGSGLFVYKPDTHILRHYCSANSTMISDVIYALAADDRGTVVMSTEKCLSCFDTRTNTFYNRTKEQGLFNTDFNFGSGIHTRRNSFVFGTAEGAVEFSGVLKMPRHFFTKLMFEDFEAMGMRHPVSEHTTCVKLDYDEGMVRMKLGVINYDNPSNVLFTWRLLGQHKMWMPQSDKAEVLYTNLPPGRYRLQAKALSQEDGALLDSRELSIIIEAAWWNSTLAHLIYGLLLMALVLLAFYHFWLKRESLMAKQQIHQFVQLAHEVRTPLSLVKAPLDKLHETETLTPKGMAYVQTALQGVNMLLQLTTNVLSLQYSRMQALQLSEVDLNDFVRVVTEPFQLLAQEKHIHFVVDSEFDTLHVQMDRSKISSILQNLIGNALKYTPDGGEVRVSTRATADEWQIEVRDTGIGIAPADQQKLFQPFFRGSNVCGESAERYNGSGIGLNLVQRLVTQHHGHIELSSCPEKGTFFSLRFPLNMGISLANGTEKTPSNTSGKREAVPILLVEDNADLRNFLTSELQSDYHVFQAENGMEALEKMGDVQPQLVISDVMMPVMDGNELCRRLKTDLNTSHIPVILLSAKADNDSVVSGLQTCADSYITKPFELNVLRATMSSLLRNRALMRRRYTGLDETVLESASSLDDQFMQQVKDLILKELTNPAFTIDRLCADMHMSRTMFYCKLKALTDCAPADFVRLIRLNYAAQLLQTRRYTVTEVADLCGFSDAKYFRLVFKNHFHQSPTEFVGLRKKKQD